MAKHPQQHQEPEQGEEMSPEQLREELKKARGRIAAMEAVGKSTRGGLTHPHDIERLHRLGLLPADDVARFVATGQLKLTREQLAEHGLAAPGDDLNTVKLEPKV